MSHFILQYIWEIKNIISKSVHNKSLKLQTWFNHLGATVLIFGTQNISHCNSLFLFSMLFLVTSTYSCIIHFICQIEVTHKIWQGQKTLSRHSGPDGEEKGRWTTPIREDVNLSHWTDLYFSTLACVPRVNRQHFLSYLCRF